MPLPQDQPGGGVKCKIGGHITILATKQDCEAAGGTVVGDGGDGKKSCCVRGVLTTSLARNIFDLGSTFPVEMDFRQQLLAKTTVGKRLLKLYFANADELSKVTDSDTIALAMFVNAYFMLFPFIQAMVEVGSQKDTAAKRGEKRPLSFAKNTYNSFVDVFKRLRFSSRNKSFYKALDVFQKEMSLYVGLTPSEALEKLGRRVT